MLPDTAVAEFANTFKEWHYLAGGFALGFVCGALAHLALVLGHAHHMRQQARR